MPSDIVFCSMDDIPNRFFPMREWQRAVLFDERHSDGGVRPSIEGNYFFWAKGNQCSNVRISMDSKFNTPPWADGVFGIYSAQHIPCQFQT